MLVYGCLEVLDTIEELVNPSHTAMMIIDMQNEIATEKGGYAQHGYDLRAVRSIIPVIQKLLASARERDMLVVYTEFVHRDRNGLTRMDGPSVYMHRHQSWVSDVVDCTLEAQTIEELAPMKRDVVLQKSRGSAFYGTYLDTILKRRGIRTLVLTGCLTEGCVLSTALYGAEWGYYSVVARDAVATLTKEQHDLGLKYLEMKAAVFSAHEITTTWNAASIRGSSAQAT